MRLLLDGSRTIRTAAATHALLLSAVKDNATLELDCRTTGDVDLSFIQLLLAARTSARIGQRTIRLVHPLSETLRTALDGGGFLDPASAEHDFWQPSEGG